MSVYDSNNVLRGTDGRVYFDGELMGFVKSFEAKLTYNKEEVYVNGDYGAKHIPTGYSIAGTYTGFKADSFFLKKYAAAAKTGRLPAMTISGKNVSPGAGANERITLRGVIPDEIMLIAFENNTLLEEEIPFTADDYDVPEMI